LTWSLLGHLPGQTFHVYLYTNSNDHLQLFLSYSKRRSWRYLVSVLIAEIDLYLSYFKATYQHLVPLIPLLIVHSQQISISSTSFLRLSTDWLSVFHWHWPAAATAGAK
jgi:hypothetical protein